MKFIKECPNCDWSICYTCPKCLKIRQWNNEVKGHIMRGSKQMADSIAKVNETTGQWYKGLIEIIKDNSQH